MKVLVVLGGAGELAGRRVTRVDLVRFNWNACTGDRPAAVALLCRAIDLGVDNVDTAQYYGNGFVNDAIREALRPEDDVVVVSKVGAAPDPGSPFPIKIAHCPEELRASIEANLLALGVVQIPVINLRRMDS